MFFSKNLTISVRNTAAQLSEPLYVYEKDRNLIVYFKIMDHKYKFDKNPTNVLASMDDIMSAYVIIVDPNGYELTHQNGEVIDDEIKFVITDELIDEITEIGTYQLQFHIKCEHSEFTIPPISFEVLERLKGIKSVIDESEVGDVITNDSESFIDEEGKLQIVWKKGDTISSVKLNQMVEVVNNAVDEEHLRKLNEQERVDKENERVTKENERIANEDTRTASENTRVTSESTRLSNESARIANEDERKSKETLRQSEENKRQTNEQTRIQNEENRVTAENARVASMSDITTRFNDLIASLPQYPEVIDARDGEVSLKARLDRDIEKAKQVYVNVEGSYITTDSSSGYAKDVEILGNTIQDPNNLADIRSVGDKVEGQELCEIPVLSYGKNLLNLYNCNFSLSGSGSTLEVISSNCLKVSKNTPNAFFTAMLKLKPNTTYRLSFVKTGTEQSILGISNSSGSITEQRTTTTLSDGIVKLHARASGVALAGTEIFSNIQLEEGTQVTPYEPYQEDKLTILSPVQLEKVGDVADRLIEKDGVWGVEKNVETKVLNRNNSVWKFHREDDLNISFMLESYKDVFRLMDKNTMTNYPRRWWDDSIATFGWWSFEPTSRGFSLPKTSGNLSSDAETMLEWLDTNELFVKYPTTQSTFIPLPHDQQVKLRTFANKTNISFLTEIEGTIKAQVPKSIGATVNTHTEQINNLNKELDRVKKLEESTVSTVTTESGFTTVEATSNGYFEDVKLEGKTLVNLANAHAVVGTGSNTKYTFDGEYYSIQKTNGYTLGISFKSRNDKLEANKTYTIIINNKSEIQTFLYNADYAKIFNLSNGVNIIKYTPSSSQLIRVGNVSDTSAEGLIKFSVLILEGDHTQNPPSYFEGLKSVGDGVDEIVVLSNNKNLFNGKSHYEVVSRRLFHIQQINDLTEFTVSCESEPKGSGTGKMWVFLSNVYKDDINNHDTLYQQVVANGNGIEYSFSNSINIRNEKNYKYIYLTSGVSNGDGVVFKNIQIERGLSKTEYIPSQSDKKRLLYYNNETQTWEKPILREWDSIEKHANGKYYYHQRSGEVVLNGSESWNFSSPQSDTTSSLFYSTLSMRKPNSLGVCDKFAQIVDYTNKNLEGIYYGSDINIRLSTSKLSTQDAQGFKKWLQANNVTLVYQLAEEKVYECTNIDLITYTNETNYVVESGVLSPKTTLKVHSNISNVVSLLQKKVSVLESNITAMFRAVLAGDYQTLAYSLYPGDFNNRE